MTGDKIFESDPSPKEKFYITVAYPYPSGAMHVGHGRTYTVPDVIARFKRMQGYNTLYPMAFHCTGTPVVGISERIKRGDKKALWLYGELYKVPKETLKTFTDPEKIVDYFSAEYMQNMKDLLLGIDWRRRFRTIDPHYKKFIEWQYRKLMPQGLVVKGEHPVKWCPNDKNAVGDHDLLQGDQTTITEYTLLKFILDDGTVLPTATLRPETIFGTTNIWVAPDVTYVRVNVNNEVWIVSRECAEKLRNQLKEVKEISEVKGSEFIGKSVEAPLTKKKVPVLPAAFANPKMGSGLVFSVPAHAPYDYAGLVELRKELGSTPTAEMVKGIEPISLIKVSGYGDVPAKDIYEKMKITNSTDKKLDEATEIVYHDEFTKGVLKENTEKYAGLPVSVARDRVKEDMIAQNGADIMYDFSDFPVVCRCNTECIVKILGDQWFLRYSDEQWKQKTRDCLARAKLVPDEIRAQFEHTISWLDDWACTRRVGLGTRFQWDPAQIIEPLSDSVIYMAYYTIAHHLKKIELEKIGDELFDYVFLGKGDAKNIPVDKKALDKMRKEFLYWHPYDWRFSAKDLVGNHLTFQIFHHTAIFPIEQWPRGIVVFGMGLLEGMKMSSSKGNVVLLGDAIKDYGADTVRFFLMASAEPWQDFDWRRDAVEATRENLARFRNFASEILKMKTGRKELQGIDRWLLSRLQMRMEMTTDALEKFQTRQALQHAFFGMDSDVRWYRRRTDINRAGARWTLRMLMHNWVRMLAPFTPQMCGELWKKMEKGDIMEAEYPKASKVYVDRGIEISEELVEKMTGDINEIIKVTGIKPKKIVLYTAPKYKLTALGYEIEIRNIEPKGRLTKDKIGLWFQRIREDPTLRIHDAELGKNFREKIGKLQHHIGLEKVSEFLELKIREDDVLSAAKDFFEKEFACKVEVYEADKTKFDPQNKAKDAMPMKPAIYVEGETITSFAGKLKDAKFEKAALEARSK